MKIGSDSEAPVLLFYQDDRQPEDQGWWFAPSYESPTVRASG